MKRLLAAFVAGGLFAAGLVVGGMQQPAHVIGFLDVENWDPTLAILMCGALAVMLPAEWLRARRMRAPLLGGTFPQFSRKDIDGSLVAGAAIFGVGWSIGGRCPGPALTSLGAVSHDAMVFVPSMIAGMLLFQLWAGRRARAPGEETIIRATPGAELAKRGRAR